MTISSRSMLLLSLVLVSTGTMAQNNTESPTSSNLNFPSNENQGLNKYERINLLEKNLGQVAERLNHLQKLEERILLLEKRLSELENANRNKNP